MFWLVWCVTDLLISFLYYRFCNNDMGLTRNLFITLFITPLIFKIFFPFSKQEEMERTNINDIDNMAGEEFELFLGKQYEKLGYHVDHVGQTRDYGADLIIEDNSERVAVQIKRYASKVGVKAIQEAISARDYYDCDRAIVITNSQFTSPATTMAEKCDVMLLDRTEIEILFCK